VTGGSSPVSRLRSHRRSGGQALHPRLDPATASPSDLDALPSETWLATSSSAKRMDGTGTAAGRREGRAAEQVSSRANRASLSSWGRLTASSMRSGIQVCPFCRGQSNWLRAAPLIRPSRAPSPVVRYGSCVHTPYLTSPATSATVATPLGRRLKTRELAGVLLPSPRPSQRGSGIKAKHLRGVVWG